MRLTSLLILDAVGVLFLVVLSHIVYLLTLVTGFLYTITGPPPPAVTGLGGFVRLVIYAFAAVLIITTIYGIFTLIRGEA